MDYAVIVPIYYETNNTLRLCRELFAQEADNIVVVNDGAKLSKSFLAELLSMGCNIIKFENNRGRGASLKAGIKFAHDKLYNIKGYITVDADGQHSAEDVMKIARAMDLRPNSIVLGKRDFPNANMTIRSKFGSRIASLYFKIITGVKCSDTLTEVKGIPNSLYEIAIGADGKRFDYDFNFLTECAGKGIEIYNLNINIHYSSKSKSNYRLIEDTYLIYATPLKFATASMGCALIDLILFTVLTYTLPTSLAFNVVFATLLARIVSGGINFFINRKVIFKNNGDVKRQLWRYIILFVGIMITSSAIVSLLSFIPIPVTIIKMLVDIMLWIVNYTMQRKWVFKERSSK